MSSQMHRRISREDKEWSWRILPTTQLFYMPWPALVRNNRENSLGVKFGNKLCCLEGFGGLLGLVTIPDLARNSEVIIHCDNAGFVAVYKKKHSHCPYSYTLAKAINNVGPGLGCRVKVEKTRRCSGLGEEVADTLSKGDWDKAWPLMPRKNNDPGRIPVALLQWINNPVPDMTLGHKILSNMSKYTKVLFIE